jgi:transcription initiation factor TFIIIB Brf1 subunit/transcription initiation factor TFIIB
MKCPKCETDKDVQETIKDEYICTHCDEMFNESEWDRLNEYWKQRSATGEL